MKFKLIEPLRELFKDEVRVLGKELGLPNEMIQRQPFPGPGLAIRVLGEVTEDRLKVLRDADVIVLDEDQSRRSLREGLAVLRRAAADQNRRRGRRRAQL